MKNPLLIAACALGLGLSTAMSVAQVDIRIGPPARPHEVIPARPHEHPDWVWQQGYHRYDGHAYVWVPGQYAAPPHPHARWVAGRWDHRGGGYVWVEGHWR
jgi:hypothetical protein